MITVVIPTWQRLEETKLLIESLRQAKEPFELICNDDNSDEEVQEYLKSVADVFIANPNKRALTRAWNNGIRIAQGDYVLLVNNDLIISPNWQDLAYTDHIITAPQLVASPADVKVMETEVKQHRSVSGCAMMVNKKRLMEFGLFDEDLEFYFSDWDMNHRLITAQQTPAVIKKVTAYHGEGERRAVWFKRDQEIFNNKYPDGTIYSSL